MRVLVVDVGGTYVKILASDAQTPRRFRSGTQLTPAAMVRRVLKLARDWRFEAVSVGYPGVVRAGRPALEPCNLGRGWVGFDFAAAFGCPVRIINDAAMQALGAYESGRMLFLGLGTGMGSALVDDGTVVAMEMAHLPWAGGRSYEDDLGERGLRRLGKKKWRRKVRDAVRGFRAALFPDDVVLGGGNAAKLKRLPPLARRAGAGDAFAGGVRLWEA